MRRLVVVILFYCTTASGQVKSSLPEYLDIQPAVFALSMVMMHDVVNPPAASRFYTYAMLGAYEIVSQNNKNIPALAFLVKDYRTSQINATARRYDHRIAAVYCILETGKRMLPSGFMLEKQEEELLQKLKKNKIPRSVIDGSIAVANLVAGEIVAYAKTDGYGKLSAKLRYTPLKGDEYWYPTPPAYMEAVEPNWKTIRPMLIDSCNQFLPAIPVPFSSDSNSSFYKMAKEVYDISKAPAADQLQIASFWDCNPFVVATSGHMSLGFKKISPGGHWMNIAGIASKKAALGFDHSILLHTILSATIMDAFISCWDEKYRSNRIRPEAYINKYIDIHWLPILQTPPFPEYTSGHSVISAASAEVLSYMLGDRFSYTDNTEDMFEIPARTFSSFREAANEAAISRLYGGIHYRDAIVNGQQQGKSVGEKIVAKIKMAGIPALSK
jgi:PAP2 superfamily